MLKKVLIGLTLFVALFIAIGFLLPSQVRVERAATIEASPAEIYDHLDDFPSWRAWDPWSRRDVNVRFTYQGADEGEGAVQTWRSEDSGDGRMEILETDPPSRLVLLLSFDDGQFESRVTFDLEEVATGTRVTWTMVGDLGGNPVARWFGLAMDGMVGSDYEQGLANLERVVEGDEAEDAEQ